MRGGRYWVRTSDLFGVNEARYHCANRPGERPSSTTRGPSSETLTHAVRYGSTAPRDSYSGVKQLDPGVLDIEGCSSCPLVTDRVGVHTRRDVALSRGAAGARKG